MVLQDINPINDQLADIIVRAGEPWVETAPGMARPKHSKTPNTLFVCEGPVVFFDDDSITRYLSWEEMQRLKDSATSD